MADQKLFSLCIPAYKHPEFLKRLLDSIAKQRFRDFDVVVTDDSPDEEVGKLCSQYAGSFELSYHRNRLPLGAPENWNEAMRKATGKWIKLLHDDDWLADEGSLQHFANALKVNPSADFFFSAFRRIFLETGQTRDIYISFFRQRMLRSNPLTLFSTNVIGHPSVVLHRNDKKLYYDPQLKWLVDIDFYARRLSAGPFVYIPMPLVCIGMGPQQVSVDCHLQRPVEIPESFHFLNKFGVSSLQNWLVYDKWWRLLRNLEIKSESEIVESGYAGNIPLVIRSMIRWQRNLPTALLGQGVCSKGFMFLHFVTHYHQIPPSNP
jgi:glycosyltransferase involved in cell wall biosynthesis